MKRYFHEELETVRSQLMLMGDRAVDNVRLAMEALLENDLVLAEKVRDADDAIDALDVRIEDEVARYISLRAPVARDLRLLFVAIKASSDLERVGDEAASIAKRTKHILKAGFANEDIGQIPRMCDLALSMLTDVLRCFIQEEAEAAIRISKRDKEVDKLNRQNLKYFIEIMKANPAKVEAYTELVFISKSMERIADHAQNIAEEVFYLLTAKSLKEELRAGA